MSTQDYAVLARDVRRRFGAVEAVRGLDLEVPYGEVTALVGPNGAGKTTLLLMLATLLAPDSGELRVAGHNPVADPLAVRRSLGWMPDTFGVYEQLTTREYLEFFAAAHRMPATDAQSRMAELLDLVRLAEFADQPVHVLSRGQKQRLALARALMHRPSVLLLDEPASGLDPRSRVELRDLLRAQAKEGTAVLVSSHILSELSEVADRVAFVNAGRTAGQHVMKELSRYVVWRIRALDGDLAAALDSRGISHTASSDGFDVQVETEVAAADLLAQLIADGVRVASFAPTGNHLESAYLAYTEEGR